MWVKGWDRVEQPEFNTKNIIDWQTTLHSRPILVPHSDTEQHKNSFVLSTPPPIGTTPVTTRWRPPHLRTSDDGSPPRAPFNSHVCTPLPSYWYLKLGAAMYHIKIKIKRDKRGVNFVVVNHLSFLRQACPEGFFGVECQSICNCGSGSTCNHETGQCTCPPGQMGSLCDHSCPSGTWGNDCSLECECDNDADCDPVSGTCICPAGYRGARCEESESSSCFCFIHDWRNGKRPRPPHSEHHFPASSFKLCQIWLCHWRGTLSLCSCPPTRSAPSERFGY